MSTTNGRGSLTRAARNGGGEMQTALVTGADRGLGLAMTAELARRGWRVFASSYLVDWPELRELASRHPESITLVPLDIGSDSSVRKAMAKRWPRGTLDTEVSVEHMRPVLQRSTQDTCVTVPTEPRRAVGSSHARMRIPVREFTRSAVRRPAPWPVFPDAPFSTGCLGGQSGA